jgi:hypothetical protein
MTEAEQRDSDCPSCGGLNISCPDGCGRSEDGELNGTRLVMTPAPVVTDSMRAIERLIANGERGLSVDEFTPHGVRKEINDEWDSAVDAVRCLLAMQAAQPVVDSEVVAQDKPDPRLERLRETGQNLIDQAASTYQAKNGRHVGIEADDGEKCWIVHSDLFTELSAALDAYTTKGPTDDK